MVLIQNEAIILQAIAFKEYDRILTLFSAQGLLKLFAKGKKRDYHFAALTAPLTHAEFHYVAGRKDLHRLHEGSIINQNLPLRQAYETLQAAENMVQALLASQWIGKPAPQLFYLFSLFIKHLPLVKDPTPLVTAFLLKIMHHEGVLQLGPLEPLYRYGGECYTKHEAPYGALFFSNKEQAWLTHLAQCRSLVTISQEQISLNFKQKIDTIFQQTFI